MYHKEFMVAILYAAGVAVGPVSLYEAPVGLNVYILFVQFFSLALINLLIFALYDTKIDQLDKFPSIVLNLGKKQVKQIIYALAAINFTTGVYLIMISQYYVLLQLSLYAMLFILLLMLFIAKKVTNEIAYRAIVDGVFLIPILYIIFE